MIPTEPVGSIPRPTELIDAIAQLGDGTDPRLEPLYDAAIADTVRIPFAAGRERRMPRLTRGPFRYRRYADKFVEQALRHSSVAVKQAVISPSALSLMYPADGIANYSREEFIDDLVSEHVTEVRRCLAVGAHSVQIDFTEARLAIRLDPTGALLSSFIDLNNLALRRLTPGERLRVGVHTCPGGDRDSTHSADVPYASLLPSPFQLNVTNFYLSLAGERDQVLEAARHIPLEQLGTTDDCGFAPFCDDQSTSRELAFAKIRARVAGTALADRILSPS